jgi:hypothetical protein
MTRTPKTAGAGHRTPAPAPSPEPVAPPAGSGPDAAVEVTPAAVPGIAHSPSARPRGNTGTSRSPGRDVPVQTSPPGTPPPGGDSDRAAGPRRRGSGSPIDPAGAERSDAAVPAAPPARRGKDARDAWRAAESALHAAQRNARGRRGGTTAPKGGYRPGMGRRTPPGGAS